MNKKIKSLIWCSRSLVPAYAYLASLARSPSRLPVPVRTMPCISRSPGRALLTGRSVWGGKGEEMGGVGVSARYRPVRLRWRVGPRVMYLFRFSSMALRPGWSRFPLAEPC